MQNFNRKMERYKNHMEMLEIKNVFDGLIRQLDSAKERINHLEDKSLVITQDGNSLSQLFF